MEFVSILLEGFLRFPLREGIPFYYEFNKKLTMIVGRNGVGKSNLLNELTPLPADKNSYCNKTGYKKIVIRKDKNLYELISDFRGGTSYSFILNGEELNTANLISAQRELVYKHFGITSVIHDIMVDRELFCTMSLNNRKKLFSTITHLNIDAVLSGYNQLKEELKNNQLLLKNATTALLVEEQKLLSPEQQASNKERLLFTKQNLDRLLDLRSKLQTYYSNTNATSAYSDLVTLSERAKTLYLENITYITAYPFKDLPRIKEQLKGQHAVVTTKLNTLYSQLEEQHKALSQIEIANTDNRTAYINRKVQLEQTVSRMKDGLRFFKALDQVNDSTYMALYKLEASLPDLLQNLQTNIGLEGEKLFTTEKYNRLVETKQQLVNTLQTLVVQELSIKNNLSHIHQTEGEINCPQCDHRWPLKDALLASQHSQEELDSLSQQITAKRSELGRVERSIDEFTEYFTLYKQVSLLRKETEVTLKPMWDVILEKNLIFTDPSNILTYLNLVGLDLSNIQEIKNHLKEIEFLDKEITLINSLELNSQEQILDKISQIEEDVTYYQYEKDHILNEASNVKQVETIYTVYTGMTEALKNARQDVKDTMTDKTLTDIINVVDDEIRDLRVTVINLEKELHHTETIQYGIDRYTEEIKDLKENIKVLELAIKELCPKTGLIAKSVSSFLNTIIHNVNRTVERVWDYKMELKPIDVGVDPLNYKFKVNVEDNLEVADVSVISSGMKEIINIAFKQVLYKLLGLDNYPFYLDEAGAKLDALHRNKYFSMLSSFIGEAGYSQIFLITHIDTSIETFKEVDVVEL